MTQIVNPSIDRVADSFLTAGSLAYAGLKEGGIVPSGQQTELAKQSAADETVLNGFKAAMNLTTDGSPTPDFTVSAGEAFIFGAWIIKDSITQLTAPTNSIITIYVGWDKYSANNVIVGQESDFNNQDSKVAIAEVTSNADGVTDISDIREFISIDAERLEGNETADISTDVSDNGATVVENVGDINVEGFSASNDGDGSATIVGEAQYTDTDAINAIDSESSLSVNISGDANTVDGFNFVENGNSASNVINYDSTNDNIDIGGQDIVDLSIDGQEVQEVTINGSVTWVRAIDATGGTTVIDRTINGVDYRIHAFESVGNSTFSVNQAPVGATVDVLVVGGGGGGGADAGGGASGGGGGGGGLVFNSNKSVSQGNYSITIGSGGVGGSGGNDDKGDNGNNTTAFGLTAIGGGGGGARDASTNSTGYGKDGGSGGGEGSQLDADGSGKALQPNSSSGGFGNDGGQGGGDNSGDNVSGGGGGASQSGGDGSFRNVGGDGGDGLDYSGTFTSTFGENGFFAGGGGGGMSDNDNDGTSGGIGGLGGGGKGGLGGVDTVTEFAENGLSNTGGGGGGAGGNDTTHDGGDGGSGIVLIRYEI